MTSKARMYTIETGTPIDQIARSQPEFAVDAVFVGKFFSGVRSLQPSVDTYYQTDGINRINLVWGMGTRSIDLNFAGRRVPDQSCRTGRCSILPAGIDYSFVLRPTDGYNTSFFIDPAIFEETFQDDHPAGKALTVRVDLFNQDATLESLVRSYFREFDEGEVYSTIALETIAMQVSLHLARRYTTLADRPEPAPRSMTEDQRIARVKGFIETYLDQPLQLSQLAEVACLSQYHFTRCFTASEGVSPHQYVIRKRLERAQGLLPDPRYSLAHIAMACGFSSQQHMTDVFRKTFATTPGAMRREMAL